VNVAVCWWPPGPAPGGRTQAIRGNTRGFQAAGHDVDLWYKPEITDGEMPDDDYDLILTPFIDTMWGDTSAHVHLQLGGYGPPDLDDEAVRNVVDAADTVSVLDTRLAYHYQDRVGLDPADARVIPNPPNVDLFDAQPWGSTSGYAMIPKVGGPYKSAQRASDLAAKTPDVTYWTRTDENTGLAGNVLTAAPVPLSAMPADYGRAELVVNPAKREGLPNVAFEAMLSERPYVAPRKATAEIQLLPAAALDPDDFGAPASWWRDHTLDYEPGDHLVPADDAYLPNAVLDLLHDRDRRKDVGRRGREWVEQTFGTGEDRWDWTSKAEAIVSVTDG
jgi:glycosyltransferase involved in cell wall biosynthesis